MTGLQTIPQPTRKVDKLDWNLEEAFEYYRDMGGKMPWLQYKRVVMSFNRQAMDDVIYKGHKLKLGYNIPYIQVVRFTRKRVHFVKRINWAASIKKRKELRDKGIPEWNNLTKKGTKWMVMQPEDWYVKFVWAKNYSGKIPNRVLYRFRVCRGKFGAKNLLGRFIQANELNYLTFEGAATRKSEHWTIITHQNAQRRARKERLLSGVRADRT